MVAALVVVPVPVRVVVLQVAVAVEGAAVAETVDALSIQRIWEQVHPFLQAALIPDSAMQMKEAEFSEYLKGIIQDILEKLDLSIDEKTLNVLKELLRQELLGFGPIHSLMLDENITDILINGPEEVFIDRDGALVKTHVKFRDQNHLMSLIVRTLSQAGRRIDAAKPTVDARLEDGSRINVVIPPLSSTPIVSIRKFPHTRFTLDQLVKKKFMNKEVKQLLLVGLFAKLNIIFYGGAGCGKTTLLNSLLREVDDNERVIVIEDTAEIDLSGKHAIRLETRISNIEGKGAITQRDLLKNALRMRPDRLLVGEIRGDEVLDMFQAMNTGFDGSLATLHASHINDLPMRLANLVAMTGFPYSPAFVLHQIEGYFLC